MISRTLIFLACNFSFDNFTPYLSTKTRFQIWTFLQLTNKHEKMDSSIYHFSHRQNQHYFNTSMLNDLVFILVLLYSTSSFVLISQNAVYNELPEAGTVQTISNAQIVNDKVYIYKITFSNTYTEPPKVVLSLNSYFYCPATYSSPTIMQLVQTPLSDGHQVGLTVKDFESSKDTDILLKLNYLVIDNTIPGFDLKTANHSGSASTFTKSIVFKARIDWWAPQVFCFLINFIIYKTPATAANSVNFTYERTGMFDITCSVTVVGDIENANWYFFGLVIIPDSYFTATANILQANSPAVAVSTGTLPQLGKAFFIGLQYRSSATQCIKIGLDASNNKLSSSSVVIMSKYQHFMLSFNMTFLPAYQLKTYLQYNPFNPSFYFAVHGFPSMSNMEFVYETAFSDCFGGMASSWGVAFVASSTAPVPNYQFNFRYKSNSSLFRYQINFTTKIVACSFMIIHNNNNTVQNDITNVESNVDQTNFSIVQVAFATILNFSVSGSVAKFTTRFDSYIANDFLTILYENAANNDSFNVPLVLMNVNRILTSTSSKSCTAVIKAMYYSSSTVHTLYTWESTHITNASFQPKDINIEVMGTFQHQATSWEKELVISYISRNASIFKLSIVFPLVTLVEMHTDRHKNEIKLYMVNILGFINFDPSEIIIDPIGLAVSNFTCNGTFVEMDLDTSNYLGEPFNMTYKPAKAAYTAIIESKILVYDNFTYQDRRNKINFIFNTTNGSIDPNNLAVVFNITAIVVKNIDVTNSTTTLACQYTEYINKKNLTMTVKSQSLIFKQIIELPLVYDIEMIYCPYSQDLQFRSQLTWKVSLAMSGLYLLVFVAALLSCQKMYGIELMYVIQLAYYSLIHINLCCYPFGGLQPLKYASGITPFIRKFFTIESVPLSNNYSSLGIGSNFLLNVNILIIPILIAPFIYFPINAIGTKSQHYIVKPRCLKYSLAFLCQVPLTFLLFSSFNICTSFFVNLNAFKMTDIISSILSIICLLLLPTAAALFIKYKHCFNEYNCEFNKTDSVLKYSKQTAAQIRKYYPLILIAEMTIVPILIAIEALSPYNFYIILALEIGITVFICVIPLYQLKMENARNCFHRVNVVLIVALQAGTVYLKKDEPPTDNIVYWAPLALVALISFEFLNTGIFIIYKCIQFWRSPGLIDDSLRIKSANLKSKPKDKNKPSRQSQLWIPRNWYEIRKELKSQRMTNRTKLITQREQPTKHFTPSEKYQMWFNQIGEKNLFDVLGINQKKYLQETKRDLVWADKEEFIKTKLSAVNVDQILESYPSKIVTLTDFIDFINIDEQKKIKTANQTDE